MRIHPGTHDAPSSITPIRRSGCDCNTPSITSALSVCRRGTSTGSFVEGWAVYGEGGMAKHGFGGPRQRLWLVTDDNFQPPLRTLLVALDWSAPHQ